PDLGDHNGANTTRFKDADMDAACDTMKNSIKTADQIAAAYTAQKVDVEKIPTSASTIGSRCEASRPGSRTSSRTPPRFPTSGTPRTGSSRSNQAHLQNARAL